uniref:Uncharacterized protein n=1 Tax=Oryza sativa subsp. japonica TaxID=39947 RepID=Q69TM9_ORYSJ|nr:hypothetical protein [Oryza sativa Japonica Group]
MGGVVRWREMDDVVTAPRCHSVGTQETGVVARNRYAISMPHSATLFACTPPCETRAMNSGQSSETTQTSN